MSHTYDGYPRPNCSVTIGTTESGATYFVQITDEDGNVCHLKESDLRWLLAEVERRQDQINFLSRGLKQCRSAAEASRQEAEERDSNTPPLDPHAGERIRGTDNQDTDGWYRYTIEEIVRLSNLGQRQAKITIKSDAAAEIVGRRLAANGLSVSHSFGFAPTTTTNRRQRILTVCWDTDCLERIELIRKLYEIEDKQTGLLIAISALAQKLTGNELKILFSPPGKQPWTWVAGENSAVFSSRDDREIYAE